MVRTMLTLVASVALFSAAVPVMAGGCSGCAKIAKGSDGFCCGKGKAFGVRMNSKKLYAALAGHKIEKDAIKCAGCKKAAKTDGRCEHCGVGAADGKFFHSKVSYALAKGKPISTEQAKQCSSCATAHKSNGFCTGCNAGFVAGRMFKGKDNYDAALAAHGTLVKATEASKKCEACAVAMVTDGKCAHCNVTFQDGKKAG